MDLTPNEARLTWRVQNLEHRCARWKALAIMEAVLFVAVIGVLLLLASGQ
jgi:hypothetical protein